MSLHPDNTMTCNIFLKFAFHIFSKQIAFHIFRKQSKTEIVHKSQEYTSTKARSFPVLKFI